MSGDFLPKHYVIGSEIGRSLFVSFDCDSLSEELEERERERKRKWRSTRSGDRKEKSRISSKRARDWRRSGPSQLVEAPHKSRERILGQPVFPASKQLWRVFWWYLLYGVTKNVCQYNLSDFGVAVKQASGTARAPEHPPTLIQTEQSLDVSQFNLTRPARSVYILPEPPHTAWTLQNSASINLLVQPHNVGSLRSFECSFEQLQQHPRRPLQGRRSDLSARR